MDAAGTSVVIPGRFRGPPGSGNGGYSCGVAGTLLGGVAEVTLRKPPPLDRPLRVERRDGIVLLDGEDIVVSGKAAVLELDVPTPPSFEEAEARARRFAAFEDHPFPECFVCGPSREPGDGLRIFAGREVGEPLVAAPFVPHESMCDPMGRVDPRVLWAALDCPGYFAIGRGEMALLGRMTAEVTGSVRAGERCVVIGWALGEEGRKLHTATALFSGTGELVGRTRQTWIRLGG